MISNKKYALLDTDFLYKSHLARKSEDNTLIDLVIKFSDYEFFCHKTIQDELMKHKVFPDPTPWINKQIKTGMVKLYSDRDIVMELKNVYGSYASNMYLTLLQISCNTFNVGFFEQYYGSMNIMNDLESIELFLTTLKECDDKVPSQSGLGEKKTFVLIQMMQIVYGNQVYVFCSDDFKARQSISGLTTTINCISILGVFYKLMKMGYGKSEMQEYYDRLSSFLKNQTEYKVWSATGYQRIRVPIQQVFDDIYDDKFQLLRNGDLQYKKIV